MKKPIPKLLGNIISRVLMAGIGVVALYVLVYAIPKLVSLVQALMESGSSIGPEYMPLVVSAFVSALSLVPIFIGLAMAEINKNPLEGSKKLRGSFSAATIIALITVIIVVVNYIITIGADHIGELTPTIIMAVVELIVAIVNAVMNKKNASSPVLMIISTLLVGFLSYYLYGLGVYFYITTGLLVALALFLLLTDFEGNKAKVEQPQVKSGPAIAEADDEKEKGDAPKAKRKFWTERGMCFSNEE